MSVTAFFSGVVDMLADAQAEFMVVGSFASSHWGESRTTRDLDLVVVLNETSIDALDTAVDRERWYFDVESLRTAVRTRSMCNLIDRESGWKVDLIVRGGRPFSIEEFDRRVTVPMLGRHVPTATAEDVILTKLEWANMSGSERQLSDATAIVALQAERLDWSYLARWATDLGVDALLAHARQLADE